MKLLTVLMFVVMKTISAKQGTVAHHGTLTTDLGKYQYANVYDLAEAYVHCYQVFYDTFLGTTYTEMCHARDKLNLCKQKVKAVFPKVKEYVRLGANGEYEFIAKYWCTYKAPKYWPVEALWYKYKHCPYVYAHFLVLPVDYLAKARFGLGRKSFAASIQLLVNLSNLRKWHPNQNYSNPSDPVYQALSSFYCAFYDYVQYRAMVVEKYCIVGNIYRNLTDQLLHYDHQHLDGLYNWNPTMCPFHPDDPVDKVLDIVDLETWLKLQVNTSLQQCHRSNVAIRGAICLIIFHTQVPPFSDVHLFMSGFCKPIKELHQCWDEVVQMCPKESKNCDMDNLIKLHKLVCDLSMQDSSLVWDIIYKWADAVKKVEKFQNILQLVSEHILIIFRRPLTYTEKTNLPFASTLNATLFTQPNITPDIKIIFQNLVSYLDKISLLDTFHFQGINMFFELSQINRGIANTVSAAVYSPLELLFTMGDFINYDPTNFQQWGP